MNDDDRDPALKLAEHILGEPIESIDVPARECQRVEDFCSYGTCTYDAVYLEVTTKDGDEYSITGRWETWLKAMLTGDFNPDDFEVEEEPW